MTEKALIAVLVILLFLPAYAHSSTPGDQPVIELNGTEIEAHACINEGNIFLPLRAVSEAIGYNVQWSGKDKPIVLSKPGTNIVIDLKNYTITADDHTYFMDPDYLDNQVHSDASMKNITCMGADFFSENLALKVQWEKPNKKIKLESIKENDISIKTVKETSENDRIKITLQYPQIDGPDNKAVQDRINSVFRQAAEDARTQGQKNADEMEEIFSSGNAGASSKCETYFDYRVKYNRNGLLSVVCTDYQYSGGAHGNTVQSSHTFNLETGAEYKLADLFNSDADYIPLISQTIRNEIDERVKNKGLFEFTDTPFQTIKEDQDFYLSDNAVVIYFQQYEHFPYAAGIQEFAVEFSALQDMLKPEFKFE